MIKSSVFSIWKEFETDPNFLQQAQFEFEKKVSISYDTLNFDNQADYKVLVYCGEPNCILNMDSEVIEKQNLFDLILTWRENILESCRNSKKFLFGGPKTISDNKLSIDKKDQISYLTSNKNFTEGHRLRQSIWSFFDTHDYDGPYEILSIKSPPYIDKEIIFNNAKFSIIVENSKQKNYFTEKITDCLSSKTIPIYWGCENIHNFFDIEGIITFNTLEDLISVIVNLDSNFYESKLEYVNKNFEESKKYWNYYDRIKINILENLNG